MLTEENQIYMGAHVLKLEFKSWLPNFKLDWDWQRFKPFCIVVQSRAEYWNASDQYLMMDTTQVLRKQKCPNLNSIKRDPHLLEHHLIGWTGFFSLFASVLRLVIRVVSSRYKTKRILFRKERDMFCSGYVYPETYLPSTIRRIKLKFSNGPKVLFKGSV